MEIRERAPNLVGMKVSDKPFATVEPYLKLGLDVFVGAESVLVEGLANGAVGAVSGVAGAFPEFVAALVREPAAEREALVGSLRELLSRHTFQASVKAALALRGVPRAGRRPGAAAPAAPRGAAGTGGQSSSGCWAPERSRARCGHSLGLRRSIGVGGATPRQLVQRAADAAGDLEPRKVSRAGHDLQKRAWRQLGARARRLPPWHRARGPGDDPVAHLGAGERRRDAVEALGDAPP